MEIRTLVVLGVMFAASMLLLSCVLPTRASPALPTADIIDPRS